MKTVKIKEITPQNVREETLYCIRDITNPGFESKRKWFVKRYDEGLRMKILKDEANKMIGFVEYIPAYMAWRPVNAHNFMFIHCIAVYSKKNRNQGYGSILLKEVEKDAKSNGMVGVCVMSSKGAWLADKSIFEHNGFEVIAKKDRFELLSKKWDTAAADPKFMDWTAQQAKYKGWHLLFANQCPWHEKSVKAMLNTAMDFGIELKIKELKTVQEAKTAPSGVGVFNLLHDGKLLEDHYLSATRFRSIIKKELQGLEQNS